uniref:Uncharacterized protein n=1 Tax=Oryza meridionalis TaxID=40149 RepID=A0A0E0F750_9ORYZ
MAGSVHGGRRNRDRSSSNAATPSSRRLATPHRRALQLLLLLNPLRPAAQEEEDHRHGHANPAAERRDPYSGGGGGRDREIGRHAPLLSCEPPRAATSSSVEKGEVDAAPLHTAALPLLLARRRPRCVVSPSATPRRFPIRHHATRRRPSSPSPQALAAARLPVPPPPPNSKVSPTGVAALTRPQRSSAGLPLSRRRPPLPPTGLSRERRGER